MTRDSAEFSAALVVGALAGAAVALSLRSAAPRLPARSGRGARDQGAGDKARAGSGEALAGAFVAALSQAAPLLSPRGRRQADPAPVSPPVRPPSSAEVSRYLEGARAALAELRARIPARPR